MRRMKDVFKFDQPHKDIKQNASNRKDHEQ